jgi:hypothetical protein
MRHKPGLKVCVCGGGCLFIPGGELNEKNFRRPLYDKIKHNNQPKADRHNKGGKEMTSESGGACRGRARASFWGRLSWEKGEGKNNTK